MNQPPECMTSAPAGTVQSSRSVASRPAKPPAPAIPGARAARRPRSGTARLASSLSSRPVEFVARFDQRQRPPQLGSGREAVQVPADVFAHVAHALVLAEMRGQQLAVSADDVGDLAESRAGSAAGVPVNAADSSANSHGRPRQPRPMTTPSQPVAAIMVSASPASKMSPLPSTGIVVHVLLEPGDLLPVRGAGVALRRGAGVQRDRGRAFGSGDPARVEVGVVGVVDADPELRRSPGCRCPRWRARPPRRSGRTAAA